MTTAWYDRLKPRGSQRMQLFLAAFMWSAVGTGLFAYGVWMLFGRSEFGQSAVSWGLLVGAMVIGLLKGRFVLSRTARKNIARIRNRPEGLCLGGFVSWKGWLMIAGMMTLGRLLRSGLLSPVVVGVIYAAVGTGLFFACLGIWSAWRRWEEEEEEEDGSRPSPG
ncbi:MAG: hypothetical protein HND57_14790 [Planctomycetes bacterium]|nr:hypothetical protein [Planctomycetota bacterium]